MTRHYIKSKVIVYAKEADNDWATSGTTLTDIRDVDVRLGLGNKKDIFSFKTSPNTNFSVIFKKLSSPLSGR